MVVIILDIQGTEEWVLGVISVLIILTALMVISVFGIGVGSEVMQQKIYVVLQLEEVLVIPLIRFVILLGRCVCSVLKLLMGVAPTPTLENPVQTSADCVSPADTPPTAPPTTTPPLPPSDGNDTNTGGGTPPSDPVDTCGGWSKTYCANDGVRLRQWRDCNGKREYKTIQSCSNGCTGRNSYCDASETPTDNDCGDWSGKYCANDKKRIRQWRNCGGKREYKTIETCSNGCTGRRGYCN